MGLGAGLEAVTEIKIPVLASKRTPVLHIRSQLHSFTELSRYVFISKVLEYYKVNQDLTKYD
jgi:hypothetical protein